MLCSFVYSIWGRCQCAKAHCRANAILRWWATRENQDFTGSDDEDEEEEMVVVATELESVPVDGNDDDGGDEDEDDDEDE